MNPAPNLNNSSNLVINWISSPSKIRFDSHKPLTYNLLVASIRPNPSGTRCYAILLCWTWPLHTSLRPVFPAYCTHYLSLHECIIHVLPDNANTFKGKIPVPQHPPSRVM
jgi:hypothetical protein